MCDSIAFNRQSFCPRLLPHLRLRVEGGSLSKDQIEELFVVMVLLYAFPSRYIVNFLALILLF